MDWLDMLTQQAAATTPTFDTAPIMGMPSLSIWGQSQTPATDTTTQDQWGMPSASTSPASTVGPSFGGSAGGTSAPAYTGSGGYSGSTGGGWGPSAYGYHGTTGLSQNKGSAKYGLQPQFWSDLSAAFSAMKSAGLGTPGVTDGFRSLAGQYDVKRRKGPLAATPGNSVHGLGLAADLNLSPAQQRWLERNGAKFGIGRLPSEPWHFQLLPGAYKTHYVAGGGAKGGESPRPTGGGAIIERREATKPAPLGLPPISRQLIR
jgi:hypothetical protein